MMTDEPATPSEVRAYSIWDSAINSINEWAVFRIPESSRVDNAHRGQYAASVHRSLDAIADESGAASTLDITTKVDADSETLWVKISTKE